MGLEERKQAKQIGDTLYEVTPVPLAVGRAALVVLVKKLAPVMASILKETTKESMTAAILGALPSVLDDADFKHFSALFGPHTDITKPGAVESLKLTIAQQDLHFAGQYLEYLEWLKFACEVNYGNFFSGMLKGAGGLPATK